MPQAMAGTLVHLLSFGTLPEPTRWAGRAFFGESIHDRCYRRPVLIASLPACAQLRRRRRAPGLVPLMSWAARPVTHKCACGWERRRVLPHPVGSRLPAVRKRSSGDRGGSYQPLSTGSADVRSRSASSAARRRRRSPSALLHASARRNAARRQEGDPSHGTARLRARGPALTVALAIFVLGTLWRLAGVLLLPPALISPACEAPPARLSGLRTVPE